MEKETVYVLLNGHNEEKMDKLIKNNNRLTIGYSIIGIGLISLICILDQKFKEYDALLKNITKGE